MFLYDNRIIVTYIKLIVENKAKIDWFLSLNLTIFKLIFKIQLLQILGYFDIKVGLKTTQKIDLKTPNFWPFFY